MRSLIKSIGGQSDYRRAERPVRSDKVRVIIGGQSEVYRRAERPVRSLIKSIGGQSDQ